MPRLQLNFSHFSIFVCTVLFFLGSALTIRAEPAKSVRLVDLTHSFDQTTIYWPTSKSFRMEIIQRGKTEGGYWYEANNISAAEHGGTHMDALHTFEGRWRVDQIPLKHLITPGVVVDVRSKTRNNPDYQITKSDFIQWEKLNGKISKNSIVLVLTGQEQYWPDKKKYLGTDVQGDVKNLHFPGFSEDSARFLTKDRQVAAVDLDTASLDNGQSSNFLAHQVFGAANVPGFKNVTNLSKLPAKGFRIIALPMKIGQGSGAPLRIVAEIY